MAKPGARREATRTDPSLLVRRTLRSGQRIRYRGNVIILGDVNPGAEVVAGGDIVVLGALRGVAHAGAAGNDQAIVAAYRLRPLQLRIGRVVARAPEETSEAPGMPEVARLWENRVVIDHYLPYGVKGG